MYHGFEEVSERLRIVGLRGPGFGEGRGSERAREERKGGEVGEGIVAVEVADVDRHGSRVKNPRSEVGGRERDGEGVRR